VRPLSQQTSKARTRRSYGRRVASLRYLPNGIMLQLEAPYDKAFQDTMKSSITSKKRIWDAGDISGHHEILNHF